jgi:gamma-aminobutyric acid receptor subunit alpha
MFKLSISDDEPPMIEPTAEPQNGTVQKKRKKRTPRFNSVSKIDRWADLPSPVMTISLKYVHSFYRFSRAFFPLSFFIINIFYWYLYLYKTKK